MTELCLMNMKKLVSFLWLVLIHLCSLSVGNGGGDESRKGGIVSFAQVRRQHIVQSKIEAFDHVVRFDD